MFLVSASITPRIFHSLYVKTPWKSLTTVEDQPNFPRQGQIPEPQWKWLNEETQELILDEMEPDDRYALFFLMTHGCRPGELRALKHKDLDLEHDTVIIRRSISRTMLREVTKTKRVRTIPLDQTWKELYLSRPRVIDPEGFVFCKKGKPLSETWLTKQWSKACARAGVPHIRLYEATRHSLASQAVNRGVSLPLIGKMLGNSTAKMTQRYSHIDTKSLQVVQRKQADILRFSKSSVAAKTAL